MKNSILWLAFILVGASAPAQTNTAAPGSTTGPFKTDYLWGSAATNRLRVAAFAEYSYVSPGEVRYDGRKGESDAHSAHMAVNGEVPLDQKWYLPFAVASANTWFDPVFGAPVPDRLNTLNLNAGLGARLNEKWTVSGSVGPVLYRWEDMDGNDVGFMASIRAVYRVKPNLTVSFGAMANPDSDIPVFPAVGARWDIETNLTLNLMFPKPGVIYRASRSTSLFLGAGLSGATFRTDDKMTERTGLPQYNDALATYWDARVGAGVEYEVFRGLSLSLDAGYSVFRQIDYKRIDERVRFDPAPYVQAGLRLRF